MAETTELREGTPVEALFRNFTVLGRDGMTVLLVPWLGIAAIDLGFVALAVAVVAATGAFDPATGRGALIQVINGLQVLAVMTLRVALLKTLRDIAFQGRQSVSTVGAALRSMLGRIGPSFLITLVVGVLVAVGLMLCIVPGLLALFFLAFAPYLVAARERGIGEAIVESARWARREWVLLLAAIVVAIVAGSVIACAMGVSASILTGPLASVTGGYATAWVLNTVLGYLAFLWWGAVYVTAESRQQIESLRQTAPEQPWSPEPEQLEDPLLDEPPPYDPSSDSGSDSDGGGGAS